MEKRRRPRKATMTGAAPCGLHCYKCWGRFSFFITCSLPLLFAIFFVEVCGEYGLVEGSQDESNAIGGTY